MELAGKWLSGHGVELGRGAHNPLAPPDCINVAPCDGVAYLHPQDLVDYRFYVAEQQKNGLTPARVDRVAEATGLPFADGELDYVASSHVLEHVPDILGAWCEWWRVLRPGGVNFMIVPKRDALSADRHCLVTTLAEHVEAFRLQRRVEHLPLDAWRTHYHVFTLQGLLAALNWYNQQGMGAWLLLALEETDSKVGNGHTLVLAKAAGLPPQEQVLAELGAAFGEQRFADAEELARQVLSLNFRVHEAWFILAVSLLQIGELVAARQACTQALILQPGMQDYHALYQALYQQPFLYPPSLLEHLARAL